MNHLSTCLRLFFLSILISYNFVIANQDVVAQDVIANESESRGSSRDSNRDTKKDNTKYVKFSFVDRELTDIINFLAKKKGVNIIPPQGVNSIKPEHKITFRPINTDLVTLDEAWNLLILFLELSGYVLTVQSDFYIIVKNDDKVTREIFPIYINISPEDLPNSTQRIRYLYYLRNLKVNDPITWDSIKLIFEEMLSPNKLVIPDPKSNGIIITDKADNISSAMRIINELDKTGFKETIEVIQLINSKAEDVKKVFDSLRAASVEKAPSLRSDPKAELSTYFPSGTVIQVDYRTNSLIIMGKESAVSRIREFIAENIDVAPESGASLLHVYDLQYLNAQEFSRVLQGVVSREGIGDQSRGVEGGGPERFFTGVIIAAENVVELAKAESALTLPVVEKAQGLSGRVFTGGNRLIITAKRDDWERIKSLIERLDKPRPQVVLEVFIVDFRETDAKTIAGDIRNTLNCNIDNGVDFLASHISPTSTVIPQSSNTIATDLLKIPNSNQDPSPIAFLDPGSMLISFNDPCSGITALLQLLQQRLNLKIVSRPHIVTLNNAIATVQSTDIRRDRGEAFTSGGGVPTIPVVDINATVQVQIIPRISSENRLSLEIGVDIDEFVANTTTRTTRQVSTNANLSSGQVLVLGGLTNISANEVETETPVLGRIPFIGWFFRKYSILEVHTNLAVFIAATIVEPKIRSGLNLFTEDKVIEGRRYISDEPIYNNRDPVSRYFFGRVDQGGNLLERYISHSSNAPAIEERKSIRLRDKKNRESLVDILDDQPLENLRSPASSCFSLSNDGCTPAQEISKIDTAIKSKVAASPGEIALPSEEAFPVGVPIGKTIAPIKKPIRSRNVVRNARNNIRNSITNVIATDNIRSNGKDLISEQHENFAAPAA